MKRWLRIQSEPIDEPALAEGHSISNGIGAVIYFLGVVRATEGTETITAIDYVAGARMAAAVRSSGSDGHRSVTPSALAQCGRSANVILTSTDRSSAFTLAFVAHDRTVSYVHCASALASMWNDVYAVSRAPVVEKRVTTKERRFLTTLPICVPPVAASDWS